jgi:hypothetical protein
MTPHLWLRLTAVALLAFAPMVASANERPGPKGSVGGGAGTSGGSAGKGGVPQMQAPVDPMQHGAEGSSPQPGSGQGTQNSKEENPKHGSSQKKASEKTK